MLFVKGKPKKLMSVMFWGVGVKGFRANVFKI